MDILHLSTGIDVSKDTLDVAFTDYKGKARTFQVANGEEGFAQLAKELAKAAPKECWRIALEATCAYHRAVVFSMLGLGVKVLVLNPKQARDLARGLGVLRKNDKTDAAVLALCAKMAWREPEAPGTGSRKSHAASKSSPPEGPGRGKGCSNPASADSCKSPATGRSASWTTRSRSWNGPGKSFWKGRSSSRPTRT